MKTTQKNGTIKYRNEEGDLHREDGPAVIYNYGSKFWYLNGKRHREDGPASIFKNGVKYWYINGEEYYKTDSIFDEAREKYPERFI